MRTPEILCDRLFVQMDDRRDEVARRLFAHLRDIFAEIGFNRFDAGFLQAGIEANLLRHHRFALGDELGIRLAAELQDNLARILGRWSEMDVPAALGDFPLIIFEIEIEMRKRMQLDRACLIAKRVEFGQASPWLRPASARSHA